MRNHRADTTAPIGRKTVLTGSLPFHVEQIAVRHHIDVRDVQVLDGSFGKQVFVLNREFLVRIADRPMTNVEETYGRVAALNGVPKILHRGVLTREGRDLTYVVLTYLPGEDFVVAYPQTTMFQQAQLGHSTAAFLDCLHAIEGDHYDIGLYVPAVRQWPGTWRAGHHRYWDKLERESRDLGLKDASVAVFDKAFRYLRTNAAVLEEQTGPRLLHNDLHPKNILLNRGQFSGVIDWECAQFGEPDFDLCHLLHWCLYPPEPKPDFGPFLSAVFESKPRCTQVPELARRLTLYEIEHDIHQVIWNAPGAEALRVPRVVDWMEGRLEQWFADRQISTR